MSIDIPASTKYVIRQQIATSLAKPVNIFSSMPVKSQLSLIQDKIKDYFVVGDLDFKRKYCTEQNSTIMNQTIEKLTNLTQTNINTLYEQKIKVQQNYRIKTQGNSLYYADDRQKRALMRFQWNKKRQEKMRNYFNMKRRATGRNNQQVNKTISYARKQIQIIPNPQFINLANDNVPEYWINSLRDNEKRLKQHIRGNRYKKQIQQQMLQTIKGRQKLINSIPSIKKQFLSLDKNSNKNSLTSTFIIFGRRSKVSCSPTQSISIFESKQGPKLVCEQVYKIQYNPSYKY